MPLRNKDTRRKVSSHTKDSDKMIQMVQEDAFALFDLTTGVLGLPGLRFVVIFQVTHLTDLFRIQFYTARGIPGS